jgi:hypothetical protein
MNSLTSLVNTVPTQVANLSRRMHWPPALCKNEGNSYFCIGVIGLNYVFFCTKQLKRLKHFCHFALPITWKMLNEVGSWQRAGEGGPLSVMIPIFFNHHSVRWCLWPLVTYSTYSIVNTLNNHLLNSFVNFLLFTRSICICFLLVQGFSIRHFYFRLPLLHKDLIFCTEVQLFKNFTCPIVTGNLTIVYAPISKITLEITGSPIIFERECRVSWGARMSRNNWCN